MDWAWLYYRATVDLKMNDTEFWNCTHRKLQALLKVHSKIMSEKVEEEPEVFGDTISL